MRMIFSPTILSQIERHAIATRLCATTIDALPLPCVADDPRIHSFRSRAWLAPIVAAAFLALTVGSAFGVRAISCEPPEVVRSPLDVVV